MNKLRLPRLLCTAVRRYEEGLGPASGWTRLTSRHRENCPDCAEFFTSDFDLEQRLRSDAVRLQTPSTDADLELGIVRAVSQARLKQESQSIPALNRTIFAGACVAAALAFAFWPGSETTRPQSPFIAASESPTQSLDFWQQVKASSAELKLTDKNPLEQEIEFVRSDSQAFVGFLVTNFLPDNQEY